jgi:hypothetical protein
MSRGQPTLYKPEYCELLIKHMASGRSFESFAATIGTSRKTLYNWRDANEDFLHALEAGRDAHLKFMEDKAIDHLVENPGEGKINTALYKLFMVNIHGWRSEPKDAEQSGQTINVVISKDDADL